MAVYKNKGTAMVIFSKMSGDGYVEAPNTINPNGTDIPFAPPQSNRPNLEEALQEQNEGLTMGTLKKAVVGLGIYSAGKSVLNYYKNNYGDIMQDSNKQAEINEAFNIIGMGASIGMGFAMGGVVGGIASIVANGVNIGLQTATYQRMMHRNSVQSEIAMARTQYSSINGGR